MTLKDIMAHRISLPMSEIVRQIVLGLVKVNGRMARDPFTTLSHGDHIRVGMTIGFIV